MLIGGHNTERSPSEHTAPESARGRSRWAHSLARCSCTSLAHARKIAGMDAGDLKVDALAPRELYLQLADQIRDAIASGRWPAARKLPSQDPMMETLGISRGTVTRAFDLLRSEGWIVFIPGKGVYSVPQDAVDKLKRARRRKA